MDTYLANKSINSVKQQLESTRQLIEKNKTAIEIHKIAKLLCIKDPGVFDKCMEIMQQCSADELESLERSAAKLNDFLMSIEAIPLGCAQ